jgi:hypothetical protein
MKIQQVAHNKNKAYWKFILEANGLTQRKFARQINRTYFWVCKVIARKVHSPYVWSKLEELEEAIRAN